MVFKNFRYIYLLILLPWQGCIQMSRIEWDLYITTRRNIRNKWASRHQAIVAVLLQLNIQYNKIFIMIKLTEDGPGHRAIVPNPEKTGMSTLFIFFIKILYHRNLKENF